MCTIFAKLIYLFIYLFIRTCVYTCSTVYFLHIELRKLSSSHEDVTDHLLFGYPTFPTYWGKQRQYT